MGIRSALKRRLETRPYVQVVSELLPDPPVSPRKMLNLALAAVLAGWSASLELVHPAVKAPVASEAKAVSQAN